MNIRYLLSMSIALSSLQVCSMANAADDDGADSVLEEIVVTAARREQSLQQVYFRDPALHERCSDRLPRGDSILILASDSGLGAVLHTFLVQQADDLLRSSECRGSAGSQIGKVRCLLGAATSQQGSLSNVLQ